MASLAAGYASGQVLSPVERGILDDLNQLRVNPPAYAGLLEQWRPEFQPGQPKIPDETAVATQKAVQALEEAISELQSVRGNLGRIISSPGLSRAAADHVRDTGSRGLTGHIGADGSDFRARIERYGVWSGSSAENIVYGPDKPREAVILQLIDYGVETRGHRKSLLNPVFQYVGIACGPHTVYGTMCVMDFAASYRDSVHSSQSNTSSSRAGDRLARKH